MSAPQTSLVRPAEQICSEINAVTKKAEFHKNKSEAFWETRKALVRELKRDYPEAWTDELKVRCQIGRTQAFKLAAIADGRTDLEKEREKNAAANRKYRASASRDGLEESGSDKAVDHAALADDEERKPVEPQPEPVSIDAPKPPEEKPREIVIRLSRKAPQTAEEVPADAMLLVGAVLRQYDVDKQQARAELIRLLTKDNEPIAPETPAMPIPAAAEEAEGNGVDVDTSAETMKSAFAEFAADLTDALSGPPKRARGRPPGSKNKPKDAGRQARNQ